MTEIAIRAIIERDIDMLLLEELASSPRFLAWFLGHAGLSCEPVLSRVGHSAITATGETDIELRLDVSGETVYVLLENKVDAPLQPRQADRYRERASRYVREGRCSRCLTGLVAPAKYLGDDPAELGFDFTVAYERLLDWYSRGLSVRDPRAFKAALIRRAIKRGAVPWRPVPNERTTEFWRRYWELAKSMAPELKMPRPGIKPETSGFVFFRPSALRKGIQLVHKVPYGHIDIQFGGKADDVDAIRTRYTASLAPGMSIEKASKSAVVRIEVPAIDMSAPFLDSEAAVREAIWAAKLLYVWYKAHAREA